MPAKGPLWDDSAPGALAQSLTKQLSVDASRGPGGGGIGGSMDDVDGYDIDMGPVQNNNSILLENAKGPGVVQENSDASDSVGGMDTHPGGNPVQQQLAQQQASRGLTCQGQNEPAGGRADIVDDGDGVIDTGVGGVGGTAGGGATAIRDGGATAMGLLGDGESVSITTASRSSMTRSKEGRGGRLPFGMCAFVCLCVHVCLCLCVCVGYVFVVGAACTCMVCAY